jgi:predicted secreted protein
MNILKLDTTVSSPITPDTAVMTMAAEKSGTDTAALTAKITQIMVDAMLKAKGVSGVEASTGQWSTFQQYDNKGVVKGWTVRSELMLKGKDFGAVGQLAGNLGATLSIVNSSFEVSKAQSAKAEAALLSQGLLAFKTKASAAAQTLGFSGFAIQEVTVNPAQLESSSQPRPMMAMARGAVADAAPVPIAAAQSALTLTISGIVQMK